MQHTPPAALLILLATFTTISCSAPDLPQQIKMQKRKTVTVDVSDIAWIQNQPLNFDQTIQPGDRILFVGDELTQQRLYTRATAAALLAIMPQADLQFFAGGHQSATAATAANWIDDLLQLTHPNVVFLCFGLNEAAQTDPTLQKIEAYQHHLAKLIDQVRQSTAPDPPRIVLLSAPAAGGQLSAALRNKTLRALAVAAQQTAQQKNVAFVDLMAPMQRAYTALARAGIHQVSLTRDGRLPNEAGHVVLASFVLYGIGVQAQQLDRVGWSPLVPRRMGTIRYLLGLPLKAPPMTQAHHSRRLYEAIRPFDQMFFDAWRLAPRRMTGPTQDQMIKNAQTQWHKVQQLANANHARP